MPKLLTLLPGLAGAAAITAGVGAVTHSAGAAAITAGIFALLADRRL